MSSKKTKPKQNFFTMLLAKLRPLLTFFLRPFVIFRDYKRGDLRPDIIAGLTVAVITLPQAMAYALIAELPPQIGLYAAIVGGVTGALWGSSSQLQTGPTNTTSLLILSVLLKVAEPGTPDYVIAAGMMAVMVGIFRLFLGLARLGVMVNFVSDSVIVGFTAGAGVLIFINQVRNILRLKIPSAPNLWQTLPNIALNIPTAHIPSLLIGLLTIVIILVLRQISRKLPGPLLGMVMSAIVVALLHLDAGGVGVVGELPSGLPPISHLPLLDFDLIQRLMTGAIAVAAIGLVEAMSIARSIAAQSGQRLDSDQEFIGQGLANIACGFLSGYTASGSFTRSAVNYESGAKTAVSSVFAGAFVLLAMLLLGPLAAYVPLPALAGVLMLTAYNLIDRKEIARIWKAGNSDRTIMIFTIVATLALPLQYAVLSGIALSLIAYLRKTSTPRVRVVLPSKDFRYFTPRPNMASCSQLGVMEILGDLYFGAVSHIEDRILDNLVENPTQRFLLLRMYPVENCDISGIHVLESIVRSYRERNGDVFFVHVQKQVLAVMQSAGFYDMVGADHFLHPDTAVTYLFHRVMDPAICIYECPVKVFRYCQNLPKRLDLVCPEQTAMCDLADVPTITPAALWDDLHSNDAPLVVDVREPREFKRAHIPDAQLYPFQMLLDQEALLPKDAPLVFVCRGGQRSLRAAALFCARGYEHIAVLAGGMVAWEKAQLLQAVELRQ